MTRPSFFLLRHQRAWSAGEFAGGQASQGLKASSNLPLPDTERSANRNWSRMPRTPDIVPAGLPAASEADHGPAAGYTQVRYLPATFGGTAMYLTSEEQAHLQESTARAEQALTCFDTSDLASGAGSFSTAGESGSCDDTWATKVSTSKSDSPSWIHLPRKAFTTAAG